MHLTEQKWGKPLIHLDCAHHVDERYYDAAVKATFGEKTDSPSQTQCLKFKQWFKANRSTIPKVVKYDPENPPIRYEDPFLVKCREDLESLKVRVTKDGSLHLPRGDYEQLWNLVQVMLLPKHSDKDDDNFSYYPFPN